MAFFESFKGKNGNFITIRWTLGEYAFGKLLGFMGVVYALGLIALIIPTLWLWFYFISIEEQRPMVNVVGIICAIYVILDYHFGLMCWGLIVPLFGEKNFERVVYYSTSLLLVHATLLLFGKKIYFMIQKQNPEASEGELVKSFFFCVVGMCIGGYLLGTMFIQTFVSMEPFPYPNNQP